MQKVIKFFSRLFCNGILPDSYTVDGNPSFVRFPYFTNHYDNSNEEIFWSHPKGHPYQVYDGPLHPYPPNEPTENQRQVWCNTKDLPGYKVVECYFTDRLYLVWQGDDVQVLP